MSEALRKAAAAFESYAAKFDTHGDEWQDMGSGDYFKAGYMAALAKPEQSEPVAYELYATKFANGQRLVYKVPEFLASYVNVRPLYADPPRREPLSDEQIQKCRASLPYYSSEWEEADFFQFVREVEAAHGIGVKP